MLEGLMVDADPEIQRIKKILYPSIEETDLKVKVKSEPVQAEDDQEDPDDPDDPTAKVTSAPSRVKPLTSVVVTQTATPSRVIQRPRVERIMNCFMCKEKVILKEYYILSLNTFFLGWQKYEQPAGHQVPHVRLRVRVSVPSFCVVTIPSVLPLALASS